MRVRFVACLCILPLTVLALGQSESEVRLEAIKFLNLVAPDVPEAELQAMRLRHQEDVRRHFQWTINLRYHSLSANERGQITRFTNPRLEGRARGGPASRGAPQHGKPFYGSEQELETVARARLQAVNWHHGASLTYRPLPQADERGEVPRSLITLRFSDQPNGFPSPGVGNVSSITLDSLSGEIVIMERRMGYSYGPGKVGISPDEAVKRASRVAKVPAGSIAHGPSYQELALFARTGKYSARGREYSREDVLPLVYAVKAKGENVLVAADNGDVLVQFPVLVSLTPVQTPPTSTPAAQTSAAPETEADARSGAPPAQQIGPAWLIGLGALGLTLTALFVATRLRR
jgi:hypothetical protein